MNETAKSADGQGRERSRSSPLSPPGRRRHADPGRSHRRDSESPGRQAPRQGGVHARQIRLSRRPRRQDRQPRSGRRSDFEGAGGKSPERQPEDHGVPRARADRSPRSARPARKPGFASDARATARRPTLEGPWKPFAEAGLLPDPSGLFLIARAITPPGRVRRFDTRFFTADASAIAHRVEGVIHADAELVELVWVELGSKPLADLHPMTRNVLGELEKRLATGPLQPRRAGAVLSFLRRQDAEGRVGGVGVSRAPVHRRGR